VHAGELAFDQARALRGMLARIKLAASQLARATTTHAGRGLARSIVSAVGELDHGLAQLAALLDLAGRPRVRSEDLCGLAHELEERLAEPLAARGIALRVANDEGAPPRGDPERTRRTALLVLRAGAARLCAGGRLSLLLAGEGPVLALALEGAGAGLAPLAPDSERALAELRRFLAVERALFERRSEGASEHWQVRFAPAEAVCSAS
jgi:hypothetical protein